MFEKSVYSFQLVTQETLLLYIITFVYSTYKCILTFWLSRKPMFKKPVYSFQLVAQEAMLLQCIHVHFVYGYYKSLKTLSVQYDGS